MNEDLKWKALRMLARHEHSRAELAGKLAAHGSPEKIHAVLDQLEQSGLLSDARYSESFVAARAPRFGDTRLRASLRAKGVAEEWIEAALEVAAGESELARAREVWQRKFAAPPVDRKNYTRQARFLQGRGFSVGVIRRLLKDVAQ